MGWVEQLSAPGSYYHLVKGGARIHPVELLAVSVLPLALVASNGIRDLCIWNAILQLALFVPLVQLPALLTQRLSYVDIGWPCGLVLLGVVGLVWGQGAWSRRALCGGLMILHGGRMAVGSLIMFFPYVFKEDLPRYQYAKVRFEKQDGMSPSLWWLKIQHDTMQQCIANCAVLAAPVLVMASDPTPSLRWTEIAGASLWFASCAWESAADMQKIKFLQNCPEKEKATAVLGRAPYDTGYWLWTLCRHPNYFGEWMCWNSFIVMAMPSAAAFPGELLAVRLALCMLLLCVSRLFYDCLVYWTGAEPAEYFSVRKRAEYRKHQEQVRVFFPMELPLVEHHRVAGWPTPEDFRGQ